MAKIIEIKKQTVRIQMENGTTKEVPANKLNFTPTVGDEVNVFESGANIAVLKLDPAQSSKEKSFLGKLFSRTKKPIKKIVYCTFALFFGSFGIHKFYAGKTGMGLAYVFLSWTSILRISLFLSERRYGEAILCVLFDVAVIPRYLSVIDFFIALFKKRGIDNRIVV